MAGFMPAIPLGKALWFFNRLSTNFVEWLFRRGWRRK
jgi:hypothetical protein